MKKIIRNLVYRSILAKRRKFGESYSEVSPYRFAKAFREFRINVLGNLKDTLLVLLAVCSAAFGLESFLLPNNFIDGGATGIALLAAEVTGMPLAGLLAIINIPFIYLAYRIVSPSFAIKTAAAIILLALTLTTIHFPEVTHDKLLVAVFGGFFLGAGIGLAVRGGSVLDGTEVLALFLSRRFGTTLGDIILIVNIFIFGVASYLLTVEAALYSMITYMVAYKTVDFIIEGIEEYIGVTIISPHFEELRNMLIEKLERGVTIYHGKRGYGPYNNTIEVDIIYSVITRLEIHKLNTEIEKIDPNAFVVMNSVKDTRGGMIKKRRFHK